MKAIISFLLSGVCHQLPEQCPRILQGTLFLCYRCSGLFLGLMITFIMLWLLEPKENNWSNKKNLFFLSVLILFWATDGLNSTIYSITNKALYLPSNALRLYSGMGMGFVLGAVLYPIAHSLWSDEYSEQQGLLSNRHKVSILGVLAIVTTLMWFHIPNSLLFWQIITATATLSAISLVNTLLVTFIGTSLNTLKSRIVSIALGAVLTISETSLLALARIYFIK